MWSDPTSWKVIVTGGTAGLGASVMKSLSAAGAQAVSIDRRRSDTHKTVMADLADAAEATRATVEAIDILGSVTSVVCCAGVDVPGPLASVPMESWNRVIAVNLIGTAAVVRAALPELERSHGRVVTVASTLAHRAVSDATAYCASKFGVVGFTRALTAEYRGRVGVTMLSPGGMDTSFFDDRDAQYQPGPDVELARPDEIADSVLWCLGRPAGIEVRELVVMPSDEQSWP